MTKVVHVVCAVICKDNKIFATQRGYGEFKDGWEFPGGKVENGETAERAIVREIREELNADIRVERSIGVVEYDYPKFHLSMECFICSIAKGELQLLEHEAAKWLDMSEIDSVDWLPADVLAVQKLRRSYERQG